MSGETGNQELPRRLSQGEYVIDAQAVAEAILRRRPWWHMLNPDFRSKMLEPSQCERLSPPVAEG